MTAPPDDATGTPPEIGIAPFIAACFPIPRRHGRAAVSVPDADLIHF
jgi:hypothetical protein